MVTYFLLKLGYVPLGYGLGRHTTFDEKIPHKLLVHAAQRQQYRRWADMISHNFKMVLYPTYKGSNILT